MQPGMELNVHQGVPAAPPHRSIGTFKCHLQMQGACGVRDRPYGIWCLWVRVGWGLDALDPCIAAVDLA